MSRLAQSIKTSSSNNGPDTLRNKRSFDVRKYWSDHLYQERYKGLPGNNLFPIREPTIYDNTRLSAF